MFGFIFLTIVHLFKNIRLVTMTLCFKGYSFIFDFYTALHHTARTGVTYDRHLWLTYTHTTHTTKQTKIKMQCNEIDARPIDALLNNYFIIFVYFHFIFGEYHLFSSNVWEHEYDRFLFHCLLNWLLDCSLFFDWAIVSAIFQFTPCVSALHFSPMTIEH